MSDCQCLARARHGPGVGHRDSAQSLAPGPAGDRALTSLGGAAGRDGAGGLPGTATEPRPGTPWQSKNFSGKS